jgi:ferritin
MNERLEKMINDQMNFEMYSAYIYMAMAAYCDSIDLQGFAHWFKMQTQEEMYHSIKMYNYLVDRQARPFFQQIPAPRKEWGNVKEAFIDALDHERIVTGRINDIATAAHEERDHATISFYNWFVDEQVEEEASVDSVIKKLNLINNSGDGLFMLDKELGARVFVTPPDLKL